jgi:putative transposase
MSDRYVGYRYPKSVIGYAVFLYHRFRLSLRDVSELLAERGITVTYETIRLWCKNLAPQFTKRLKKKLPHPSDKIHIDEVRTLLLTVKLTGFGVLLTKMVMKSISF